MGVTTQGIACILVQAVGFSLFLIASTVSLSSVPGALTNDASGVDVHMLVMNILTASALMAAGWNAVPRNIKVSAPIISSLAFAMQYYGLPDATNEQWRITLLLVFCVASFVANVVQFGMLANNVRKGGESSVIFCTASVVFACGFVVLIQYVPSSMKAPLVAAAYLSPIVSLMPHDPQESTPKKDMGVNAPQKALLCFSTILCGASSDLVFALNGGSIISSDMGISRALFFAVSTICFFTLLVQLARIVQQETFSVFYKSSIILNMLLVAFFIWSPTLSTNAKTICCTSGYICEIVAFGTSVVLCMHTARRERYTDTSHFSLDGCGLTPRELEIAKLLAQGWNAPAIQKKLVISRGTVWTHISHIYEKMDVGSRNEFLEKLHNE